MPSTPVIGCFVLRQHKPHYAKQNSTALQVTVLAFLPGISVANVLEPLGVDATEGARKWQPVLDFDTDTCYHTAAISPDGSTNEGLDWTTDVSECRSEDRLWHSNTYARERCNHYWCAYMYGYYSEMDYVEFLGCR